MNSRVAVTGASGFVGTEVVAALVEDFTVRAVVRDDDARDPLAQESVRADVAHLGSLEAAFHDCDAVVHLVAIIKEKGSATFEGVIAEGTRNVTRACSKKGVKKIVYVSALGTGPNAPGGYFQAKWAAERFVVESGCDFVILRPSIIVGKGDDFVNRFAGHFAPLPDDGATTFQPVFVKDVAEIIRMSLLNPDILGVFEVGGPEVLSLRQMINTAEKVRGQTAAHPSIPLGLARLGAKLAFDPLLKLGLDMPTGSDALDMLSSPNVCGQDEWEKMKRTFPIKLTPFERAVIE